MSEYVGIDLGTTFSAIAKLDEVGRPVVIRNRDGSNLTPSAVCEDDGTIIVGEVARRVASIGPNQAATRFKRDMGTEKTFRVKGHEFTPTELSVFVLKRIIQNVDEPLGDIGEVVVTIPANFSNEAREATLAAAHAAGLNVRYIINEPTAAALYYAFKASESLDGVHAVYDLGGGTFDVSVIRVVGQEVHVIASNGVARLGGDDFDEALRVLVAKKYRALTGQDLDPEEFTRFDAEAPKVELSQRDKTLIRVGRNGIEVTRREFEESISTWITQAEMLCEATLEEAAVDVSDVRSVLLAGGSTRIPLVRTSIQRVFGKEPTSTANVDEVVALGAALYAAYRGNKSTMTTGQASAVERLNVTETSTKYFGTLSFNRDNVRGVPRRENAVLIHKGTKLPCSVTESFYTVYDGQTGVDCTLTEASAPETDPRFVKIVWEGKLELPAGRPSNQEIQVTFAYDDNQLMHCTFTDVASGKRKEVDVSPADYDALESATVDQFLVE